MTGEGKKPPGGRAARIEGLRRRGEFERETLASEVAGLRRAIDESRSRWKTASWIAGGLAAAWTVGHKLFGRRSLSAKLGRVASVVSLLFGAGRAVGRIRRFW